MYSLVGLVGLTLLNGSGFESGFLGFQKVSMEILRSKFSNNALVSALCS